MEDIKLPKFDRNTVTKSTKEAPSWIHFGAGNIFRAFCAADLQKLLDEGIESKGVIVAEGFDYEIIDKAFLPYDNLTTLVTLKANGTMEKTKIASIVEALKVDETNTNDWERLKEIFTSPSLQMASFTITEKGYAPTEFMKKVTALLFERYKAGGTPLAMVSMDNCAQNGTRLFETIRSCADALTGEFADKDFINYIENKVSFPWTMIDKITPRPDEDIAKRLNAEIIVTSKNTYTSSFVNAEEVQYLVIEDTFPNGRPKLEEAGVYFADRTTVEKVEKMKVCTCLNPLHTALAVFGCLLGYTKISEEMKDKELVKLVEGIGYKEGLPVVTHPKILEPKQFIDDVLTVRLPNPFMPDAPQRIACDTSQKVPIRFGETIKAYAADDKLDVADLTLIPLVLAGWCRYLLGIDDEGNAFECSPDPKLDELQKALEGIGLGSADYGDKLRQILSNADYFAVDLYAVGLGEKVEGMFGEMIKGKGAVRGALERYT